MGNNNSNSKLKFDVKKYRRKRPHLSEQEIISIYNSFLAYKPINGEIRTKNILSRFSDAPEISDLKKFFYKKVRKSRKNELRSFL